MIPQPEEFPNLGRWTAAAAVGTRVPVHIEAAQQELGVPFRAQGPVTSGICNVFQFLDPKKKKKTDRT